MQHIFNPFAGTIGRGKWWLSQLIVGVAGLVLLGLLIVTSIDPNEAADAPSPQKFLHILIVLCVCGYMNFCSCLNRLRDTQSSGWWFLAFFAPYVGTGLMIYKCGIQVGLGAYQEPDYAEVFGDAPDSDPTMGPAMRAALQAAAAPKPHTVAAQRQVTPAKRPPQTFGRPKTQGFGRRGAQSA